ncbi:hypothetical protein [Campylobacter magnus]|uniref:Uncharacterized protein n=1 Tax=Campylobacter magnus TaxID=3026462 RepID=A0ABT8T8H0_9BACT|nr:hypothetical protein [Campylobacter magnus]MDO2408521.1 hypothetical protein [Campylobacter magnus]
MSEKSKVEQKTAAKTASKSKAAAVVSKPIAKKSAKDGLNKTEPKTTKNSRIPKDENTEKTTRNSRIPKAQIEPKSPKNSRIPKTKNEKKNTPHTPQKTSTKKAEPKSKTTTKTASKAEPKSKVEAQKELFRTKSGHLVCSKSEVIIADYLYGEEICFAYEKRLPIETEARCDFYVPACSAYIEYWGVQSDEAERKKYEKRKKEKIALYKKHALNLIEIDDKNIKNLEDFLQKELLKLGLKVFK